MFDRGRLGYLNGVERAGWVYCSYANGLLACISEIAARTEQRFCPLRHARPPRAAHSRSPHFLMYGDDKVFRAKAETVEQTCGDIDRKSKL